MKHFVIVASVVIALNAGSAFADKPGKMPKISNDTKDARDGNSTRIAFVDFQRLSAESVEGRDASTKVNALVARKQAEIADRAKALQAKQQKLAQSGPTLSEEALAQLQREIQQQTRDDQRFQQDAQAEINELQQQLLAGLQTKISPSIDQVRKEKNIQLVLDRKESGIVSSDPALDISGDVIKKLNAAAPKEATPRP